MIEKECLFLHAERSATSNCTRYDSLLAFCALE